MGKNIIEVKHLHKTFRLPHEKHSTLKQTVLNFGKRSYENLKVLNDISFEVKKGEFFGIVGRNGSGKSTLLKILAGIYKPTSGSVNIDGLLTPFIELGIGFNPELTGRENVFLNGTILGLTQKEIAAKYDEIVAFAELEKFMDQKIKNYSSGMQVRLAFSIAIQAQNEILLIDEVLAVGDNNFQQKCFNYFRSIKSEDRTIIFVSHDMETIKQFCNRALLLEKGKITKIGAPRVVANEYSQINLAQARNNLQRQTTKKAQHWGTGEAVIKSLRPVGSALKKPKVINAKDQIKIEFLAKAINTLKSPTLGIVIENAERRPIFATNTPSMGIVLGDIEKGKIIRAVFTIDNIFTDGQYWLSGAISNSANSIPRVAFDRVERMSTFLVAGRKMKASITHPKHSLRIKQ